MNSLKLFFCALGLFLSANVANAITYSFVGPSWKQLQDPITFQTLCETGLPCDVPAGTYNLVDFGTSPATVTSVTVGAQSPGTQQSGVLTVITENCNYQPAGIGYRHSCLARCPAGMKVISALSCSVRKDVADSGQLPSGFVSRGDWAKCESNGGNYTASIEISIVCQ